MLWVRDLIMQMLQRHWPCMASNNELKPKFRLTHKGLQLFSCCNIDGTNLFETV